MEKLEIVYDCYCLFLLDNYSLYIKLSCEIWMPIYFIYIIIKFEYKNYFGNSLSKLALFFMEALYVPLDGFLPPTPPLETQLPSV